MKDNWYIVCQRKSDNIKTSRHFVLLKDVIFFIVRMLFIIFYPFRGEQNNLKRKGIKSTELSSFFGFHDNVHWLRYNSVDQDM